MSLWRQALEVARTDLIIERRLGDTFRIILPFAVVALMIFSLVIPVSASSLEGLGTAVFWVIAVLYGMQVALRASTTESAQRRDVTILIGLDPAARFLGRSLAAATLLVGFMAILLGATIVLFSPETPPGWWLPSITAVVLESVGLAMLATLAGEVAVGLRNQSTLAPLIVAPLVVPLVIGASQVAESILRDDSILIWILLLITTDLSLLVAGIGLSRPLEEASR